MNKKAPDLYFTRMAASNAAGRKRVMREESEGEQMGREG
jgi:hypothetical protein